MIVRILNLMAIIAIVVVSISAFYILFRKNKIELMNDEAMDQDELTTSTHLTLDFLCKRINQIINKELRIDVANLNLNKTQAIKKQMSISILRKNIHICNCGDINAKNYIKQIIKSILIDQLGINEDTINKLPQFGNDNLSDSEMFDIVLFWYKKKYGYKALEKMIEMHHLDERHLDGKDSVFAIVSDDIRSIYNSMSIMLDGDDMIDVLTQWIYQNLYGHGVIDEIRDMNIDGISGGVGGLSSETMFYAEEIIKEDRTPAIYSYNHICIMYHGKTIYLKFLGFGKQRELERVCKNLCRYNSPGQFSQDKGFMKNDMKDGSRVTVVRPPMSNSWAFVLRKHGNIGTFELEDLLTDEGSENVIKFLTYIALARKNVIFTGNMAVGKSTTLRSFLNKLKKYNLRIQEALPELHYEKVDPDSNVLSFREIPTVSGQDILELQKTTDGAINVIGEIASPSVAAWYIQTSQNASLMSVATNHCMTTDSLLKWFRNALITECNFNSATIALEQVVEAIRFDVHLDVDIATGHRYISRITEVVPVDMTKIPWDEEDSTKCMVRYFKEVTEREIYKLNDIFVYSDGKYIVKNRISSGLYDSYRNSLSEEQLKDFDSIFEGVKAIEF